MVFLEGFGIGLGMIIFIGPVFFTLLKSTLQYGFIAGMLTVLGIILSDVICVVLCSFGAIPFFQNTDNQFWLAVAGSIILFALGLRYLLRTPDTKEANITFKSHHYPAFFAKGFLVNFVNPFVFIVWIGVIGYAHGKFGYTSDLGLFLGAALLGIFTTDTAKVLFAHRIKAFIKPEILLWVFRIIGIVLIIFGIRLAWFAINNH